MNFTDAIKTGFSKYATFDGCASRPEYWWWTLFIVIGAIATAAISPKLELVFLAVTLLPSLTVATRRLHDTDRSGWLQLLSLIPLVGAIILLIWLVQPGKPSRFA